MWLGLSEDVGHEFMNDDNDNRDDADGVLLYLDESRDYAPQDWLMIMIGLIVQFLFFFKICRA